LALSKAPNINLVRATNTPEEFASTAHYRLKSNRLEGFLWWKYQQKHWTGNPDEIGTDIADKL
jgi:hypothetical protein